VSDLHREWVLILCHLIYLILLSDICFGVWSLQRVSVDFVPPNLFDFAEWHLLWCLISTGSECWFFWATSALVSDLYSLWVLILCYQICLIFLNNICFDVWSLQRVSVDFVPPNLFHFSQKYLLWCSFPIESECQLCWLCVFNHISCFSPCLQVVCGMCCCYSLPCTSLWVFLIDCFDPAGLQFVSLQPKVTHSSILIHWFSMSLYIQSANVDCCISTLVVAFPSLVCKPMVQC